MSPQANVAETHAGALAGEPSGLRVRPLYWSVRRELWENRAIYIAPLAVAAAFLLSFLISAIGLTHTMHALSPLDPAHPHQGAPKPYDALAGLIMATTFVVGIFYSLDALYGERRDRSILFWKSLPVSDLTAVLAKASIPIVILPMLTVAVTVATQLVMLLVSAVMLSGSGLSAAALWTQLSFSRMWLMLFYHLVTVHALWHAPMYGWLLLVSAWARRATLLWAFLPPFAIGVVERIAFNTSHFAAFLEQRLAGGAEAIALTEPSRFPMDPMAELTPGHFLSSPGLWIGLIVTAAFLVTAARMRRYRDPI